MEPWQYILAVAAPSILLLMILSGLRKRKRRKQRDFTRKLETALQPEEEIQAVYTLRGVCWVATDRRLLRNTKMGFGAIPYEKIRQLKGVNEEGGATVSAKRMVSFTVKADQDYSFSGKSEAFTAFAAAVSAGVKKAKAKSKARKDEGVKTEKKKSTAKKKE